MKRGNILKMKAHQLARFCIMNVFLVIDHPLELCAYKSVDENSWPPPYKVPVGVTRITEGGIKLRDLQETDYPN